MHHCGTPPSHRSAMMGCQRFARDRCYTPKGRGVPASVSQSRITLLSTYRSPADVIPDPTEGTEARLKPVIPHSHLYSSASLRIVGGGELGKVRVWTGRVCIGLIASRRSCSLGWTELEGSLIGHLREFHSTLGLPSGEVEFYAGVEPPDCRKRDRSRTWGAPRRRPRDPHWRSRQPGTTRPSHPAGTRNPRLPSSRPPATPRAGPMRSKGPASHPEQAPKALARCASATRL